MRLLKGTFPTVLDADEMGLEIKLLNERGASILPQLRDVFLAQIKSATDQLHVVRAALERSRPKISSSILEKLITKRWEKLIATVMMAEAYCS
jgi:hypothetical protein